MPGGDRVKPGLQAERTALSWERSAFGFLVGGALVLLRPHGPLQVGRTLLASLAGLLALAVLGIGYLRSRRVRAGGTNVPPPQIAVMLLGYGTAVFALTIVIALLFTA